MVRGNKILKLILTNYKPELIYNARKRERESCVM